MKWHAIETKLPKPFVTVLLYLPETETILIGMMKIKLFSSKDSPEYIWVDSVGTVAVQPSHWMPLPKPPAHVPRLPRGR